ncbi:MAG: YIP1 family protein, partial [Chloroflexi bacterium]|nr:YIP1 family protein [Chloroflexota bacterium]
GATFRQRYGHTLTEFITGLVQDRATVAEVNATENSQGHAAALLAEIEGMEQRDVSSSVQRDLIARARAAAQGWLGRLSSPARTDAQVIVCASGNLANVYFKDSPAKIGLQTLNKHYPGLVDALVAHPGVGVVIAYADDGAPLALGQGGSRNLRTGAVTGSDPLTMYGDPDLRAAQLLRLAEFPHAGDLVVNSTLYPDGEVAAFEELVGSHGGLGGPQTDAILLHPADMAIPATSNATDVFALLNARRGLPGEPLQAHSAVPAVDAWSPKTLWAGLRDVRTWVLLALRALRLDRAAFREVAEDPFATGPALLIVLVTLALRGVAFGLDPDIPGPLPGRFLGHVAGGLVAWLLMVVLAQAAGRLLRGKGDFTRTMRALAFAEMPQLIGLLQLVPVVGPLFLIVSTVMGLLAMWIALQQALELRGLVAALIPVVGLVVLVAAVLAGALMVGGTTLTVDAALMHLGLAVSP